MQVGTGDRAVGAFAERVITAYKKVRPAHKPPLDVFFDHGATAVQGKVRGLWRKLPFENVLELLDKPIKVTVVGRIVVFDWPDTRVITLIRQ